MVFQKSLLAYWDVKNVSDTSFEEGEKVGIEKEKLATVKAMLQKGLEMQVIIEITGLRSCLANQIWIKSSVF